MASEARTALDEMAKDGAFARTPSVWRDTIQAGGRFAPEAGRYHLYVSLACPWACRCVAALHLKGLTGAVGLSITHPTWQRTRPGADADAHCGWAFRAPGDAPVANPAGQGSFGCEGCVPDGINGASFVRDLYELAGDTGGKYTVPVLWDTRERTIVNNESSEILRILNSQLNEFAGNRGLDLYPEALRAQIDDVNAWVYDQINNGVYRAGFAKSQAAYEAAFKDVFDGLDRCEAILGRQRYIAGDELTEADVRLFATLIRFDEVYVVYFKTNKRFLHEYAHLPNYVRDVYHTPGMAASVDMQHIKKHYFSSHPLLNPYAIVPVGGEPWWEGEHDRHRMTKSPVKWIV